ncbi:Ion transport protein-domain-containing protein [Lipomyces arxii]|uniref:Ion transport protein-domain-containing protein n=1 Tax=Lipomyces arxii TaxID=56418 RepID=UPI0034CD2C92
MSSGPAVRPLQLQGKSLGLFSAANPFRQFCYELLKNRYRRHFELFLLVFYTVVVTKTTVKVRADENAHWPENAENFLILGVFVCYTILILINIVTNGFLLNSDTDLQQVVYDCVRAVSRRFEREERSKPAITTTANQSQVINTTGDLFRTLAYLRSSWNRVNFVGTVSYWVYLFLSLNNPKSHDSTISIFRALSSIILFRWLSVSNYTLIIPLSIKAAWPTLVNMGAFTLAFSMLFAALGLQSFNGSFNRHCLWTNPNNANEQFHNVFQSCGSYLNATTKQIEPWKDVGGGSGGRAPKGYTCPINSICVQHDTESLYGNTVNFDRFLNSLELVFVVLGMNGFSDLMARTIDSDHFISVISTKTNTNLGISIIILAWWMFNLFIAIISTSFAATRELAEGSPKEKKLTSDAEQMNSKTRLRKLCLKLERVCIIIIFADFTIECLRARNMSRTLVTAIDIAQDVTTIVLLVEVIFRFISYFPSWRKFFDFKSSMTNYVDVLLAVVTSIILLPHIRRSKAYPWLSGFQVARLYRVVVALEFTRTNWLRVARKYKLLRSLIVSLVIILVLCTIMASQLMQDKIESEYQGQSVIIRFDGFFNSFAGVYQIMTTEGWAPVLYTVTGSLSGTSLAWTSAIFICGWFFFANSVVVNLFIAAIQENFETDNEEKKSSQIWHFVRMYEPTGLNASKTLNYSSSGDHYFGVSSENAPIARLRLPSRKSTALLSSNEFMSPIDTTSSEGKNVSLFSFNFKRSRLNLLKTFSISNPFYRSADCVQGDNESVLEYYNRVVEAKKALHKDRKKYLHEHKLFDRSLFLFAPTSKIRQFCQKLVGPSHGVRYSEVDTDRTMSIVFSSFIMCCVAVLVAVACINTPFWQREHLAEECVQGINCTLSSWVDYFTVALTIVFTVEAFIKIIANGFVYSPNAYIRSTWNFIDFFVLITLWIEVILMLSNSSVSRIWRAFKAFRALRLLHVSHSAKTTFHSIIIVGIGKIFGAAVVSLTLLLPFSLWGLILFRSKFDQCTDYDVDLLSDCNGEYASSVYDWNYLFPRADISPGYSFDSFLHSFSILFQIISLEGWNDVLQSAQSVTGVGKNPRENHSIMNGVFIYFFNFISIIFISTLFIAVIKRNYELRTGTGILTLRQRSFMEMQSILLKVRPARTGRRPNGRIRKYLYQKAVLQSSPWHNGVAILITIQFVFMCLDNTALITKIAGKVDYACLVTSSLILLYRIARLIGLQWESYFRGFSWLNYKRNLWDIFWFLVIGTTFILSIAVLLHQDNSALRTMKNLLLVMTSLLLITKSDRLTRLFVAASACFLPIVSLLFTWFILFLVYAIALNQVFGLTKIGPNGSTSYNFRTIPKAMLLLFRMSCGEGWNDVMYDHFVQAPYCIENNGFLLSDCGSKTYAYILFVSWNIISMYIFANMFISFISESFSYVYQQIPSDDSNGPQCSQMVARGTIRSYKEVWDKVDITGIGYIQSDNLARLLRLLPYPMDVQIYRSPHDCLSLAMSASGSSRRRYDVDIDFIMNKIADIDVVKIQEARNQYTALYREITYGGDREMGISFSGPLTTIPFYKIYRAEADCLT